MNPESLGLLLSLASAVVWALAIICFRRSGETVHPLALNVFKNLLALVLLALTMILAGQAFYRPVAPRQYLMLLISGAVGIGVGDTLFFASLNRLGAGSSSIVICSYVPMMIGLSMIFLGERLSLLQGVGAAMVVGAILVATFERRRASSPFPWAGFVYGILAALAMASGVILIKRILERSPVFWVTAVRLAGGLLALAMVLVVSPGRRAVINSLLRGSRWSCVLLGSFLGAYCAMVIWLTGMKHADAAVAAILNQTSALFVVLFARLFLQEALSARKAIGLALALAGIALIFLQPGR